MRVTETRELIRAGHVACIREVRNVYNFVFRKNRNWAVSCEHKISGSIENEEFLDQPRDHRRLKEHSVPPY
jgi:hypothetical protein